MKRISIYVSFSLSILTAVIFYDYKMNSNEWQKFYQHWFAERVDRLPDEALVAVEIFVPRQNLDELSEFLESRRRNHAIDYWAVVQENNIVETSLLAEEAQELDFDLQLQAKQVAGARKKYHYAVRKIGEDRFLVLGVWYKSDEFIGEHLADRKTIMMSYCIGLSLICILIFLYFFRDFMRSVGELARGGLRSFGSQKSRSREAETLARGLLSYEEQARDLKKENQIYTWQVLPSLRTELASGRKPPYEFDCTLVRTDINHFSQIYNQFPVAEFAASINEFFKEVCHVVARYDGLVHEFLGDEVIYYFKDEVCGNSALMAISAIREINAIAERYHQMTTRERGYGFTVKSSLAHGRLLYGEFVNRFGVSGPVLIETVRILSQVQEKSENVVVFDSRHLPALEAVVSREFFEEVQMKGFSEKHSLYVYRGHRSVQELLKDKNAFAYLRYYRSDEDHLTLLNWVRARAEAGESWSKLAWVIGFIRQVQVTACDGRAQSFLLSWIEGLIGQLQLHVRAEDAHLLSALIGVVPSLLPHESFSADWERVLKASLELSETRVVANAIDTLTHFRRSYDERWREALSHHYDPRVVANALVHEGILGLRPFVVRRLAQLLESSSSERAPIASALYALGEIASFHRQRDPVYFGTQIEMQNLLRRLPEFALHRDARVRTQALRALHRLRDAELINEMWAKIDRSQDKSFRSEAIQILGSPESTPTVLRPAS
jgi:class 3 adenylate cyclase